MEKKTNLVAEGNDGSRKDKKREAIGSALFWDR
jgi:hypothetical protein